MSRRTIPKFIWIGVAAAVIAVTAIVTSHTSIFAESRQTQNGSPTASFKVQDDPEPMTKAPTAGSDENSSNNSSDPSENSSGTTPTVASPGVTAAPITKDSADPDSCSLDMNSEVSSYNHDVQKQKDLLDNILSFKVGSIISGQYVSDYNTKVTSIFNEYLNEANESHCTWPLKTPALLPSSYSR